MLDTQASLWDDLDETCPCGRPFYDGSFQSETTCDIRACWACVAWMRVWRNERKAAGESATHRDSVDAWLLSHGAKETPC